MWNSYEVHTGEGLCRGKEKRGMPAPGTPAGSLYSVKWTASSHCLVSELHFTSLHTEIPKG